MQRPPLIQTLGRLAAAVTILIGLLPLGAGAAAAGGGGASGCPRGLDTAGSFESVNVPGHFIRHRNALGALTPVTDGLAAADATFIVRPGLSGTPQSVSFEAVDFPGHFLRHEQYRIKLSPKQDASVFRQDASFVVSGEACRVRLESVNFPGHFIRHQNFELWLANDMAGARDLFAQDTTWEWQAPRYDAQVPEHLRPGTHTVALEVARSKQKSAVKGWTHTDIAGNATLSCKPGDPGDPAIPAKDFWVGWGQLEINDDPCYAGVAEAAVIFDEGPLNQVPNKTIDRAVLTFDEASGQGCQGTPCWADGNGRPQQKAGCVGVLGIPTQDWINVEPPGLIPHMTLFHGPPTREWDVSVPYRQQYTRDAPLGGSPPPPFGFLLAGGPSLEQLTAEDSTNCHSWISNIRLHVTFTVPPGSGEPPVVR